MRNRQLGQISSPSGEMEIVGVRLSDLQLLQQQAAASEGNSGGSGCCCKQFVETSQPTQAEPFRFSGASFQLSTQFSIVNVFQVPAGMEGVINRFGIYEIMPGMQSGNRISLLINGEFCSQVPRIAGNIGNGAEAPLNVNIYLKQNDIVQILMDCPFILFQFEGIDPFLEYSIAWIIEGYYINDGYFAPLSGVTPGGVC